MAVDVQKYLSDLLAEAGASEEQKQAIAALAQNEKFSKPLADGVMRHDEYSRSMDALRVEKARTEDWWKKESERTTHNQKIVDQLDSTVKAYETKFGPLDGAGLGGDKPLIAGVGDVVSRKDFEDALKKQEQAQLGVLAVGLKLTSQHIYEFKEPLDVDAVIKLANEKGLSAQAAYDEFVKPKREAVQKATHEAELKTAREDGAREFASTHKIPVDTKPREAHMILDRKTDGIPADQAGQTRFARDSFVNAWNEAGTSGTSRA